MIPCFTCEHYEGFTVRPASQNDPRRCEELGMEPGEGMIIVACAISDEFVQLFGRFLYNEEMGNCYYMEFMELAFKMTEEKKIEGLIWLHEKGLVGLERTIEMMDAIYGCNISEVVMGVNDLFHMLRYGKFKKWLQNKKSLKQ